jgi:hypothetical protein
LIKNEQQIKKTKTEETLLYRERKRKHGLCYEGGCKNKATRTGSKCEVCAAKDLTKNRKYLYKYTPEQEAKYLVATVCDWCELPLLETPHQDHDRHCCFGNRSCGKCLRGLVHSLCNTSAIPWFEWYETESGVTLPMLQKYRSKFNT